MKKNILLLSLFVLIILSTVFYIVIFKKDEIALCPILEIECPDGFLSKCNYIYDMSSGTCVECLPDCTGHETPINQTGNNSTGIILCPDISPPTNFCRYGELVPIYDNNIGCVIDYRCK